MTSMKLRVSGDWVDSTATGSVRINGETIDYGPPDVGPTYESIVWPNEPTLVAADDGASTFYNMGIRFHLLASKQCVGVRWRVPDTVAEPTGGHAVGLYNVTDQSLMRSKDFTPTPGQYQDILFDTPATLSIAPQEYVVSVWTRYYVYSPPTPSDGWLVRSPSLNVRGDDGVLGGGARLSYPSGRFNSWYFVAPLVEI